VVQDLWQQCPHPVPCREYLSRERHRAGGVRERSVWSTWRNATACKKCLKACPWEMISFDPESNKAHKMLPLRRKAEMRGSVPGGGAQLSALARPDRPDPPRVANAAAIPPIEPLPARSAISWGSRKGHGSGNPNAPGCGEGREAGFPPGVRL